MAAEADGVQGASVAEGDFAVVDFVGADAVVGPVWGFVRGSGFGSGGVGRGGGASVEGAVGSVVVVLVAELVEVNRPGMSGDFEPWEGWSHGRKYLEAVPA